MNIYILTLFPGLFEPFLSTSIINEARCKGLVNFHIINFRDFAKDKHKTVDDIPFGGGSGMILKVEPIFDAFNSIPENIRKKSKTVFLTPRAPIYNQQLANEFAGVENLIIVSGHYKDFDERIFKLIPCIKISIGDYVLSGGEIPAMVIIDSVVRLIPGVINDISSANSDSFGKDNPLLGYPSYTRPRSFRGLDVPDVLLSGNHKKIEEWREMESINETYNIRPEILKKVGLNKKQKDRLKKIKDDESE